MNRPSLAITLILTVVLISIAQPSWAQLTNVNLSLKRVYGDGPFFRECQLDVVIAQTRGRLSLECVRAGASSSVTRSRDLMASEVNDILKFAGASDLFGGGHIGTDATSVHGLFETLKVTQPPRTVVLVSSGNDSFTMGSRRDLIRLLYSLLNELQKAATQG